MKMLKLLPFFLLYSFSEFSVALDFDVKVSRDRMYAGAIYSNDGRYYTRTGSAQTLIYDRQLTKKLGAICCLGEAKIIYESFVKDEPGEYKILSVAQSGKILELKTFNLNGSLSSKKSISLKSTQPVLSVVGDDLYLALLDSDLVTVFDGGLEEVKSYRIKSALEYDDKATLVFSKYLSSFLLYAKGKVLLVDALSGVEVYQEKCLFDKPVHISPNEAKQNHFLLISENGKVCDIENGEATVKNIDHKGSILGVYFDEGEASVVAPDSICVFNSRNLKLLNRFSLPKFYKKQYGKIGINEYPIFVNHKFDHKNKAFYLRGHSSIRTFFEIKVIN